VQLGLEVVDNRAERQDVEHTLAVTQQVDDLVAVLHEHGGPTVEHLRDMDRPLTGVTLMSDGRGVYEAHSPEAVVDLLQSGQGVFEIAIDRVWTDVEKAVPKSKTAAKAGTTRRRAAGGA